MGGFPCLGGWPALWRVAGCLGLQSQTYFKIKSRVYAPGRGHIFVFCAPVPRSSTSGAQSLVPQGLQGAAPHQRPRLCSTP